MTSAESEPAPASAPACAPALPSAERNSLRASPEAQSAGPARLRDTIARRLADLLFLPPGQLAPAEKALIDSLLVPLFDGLEAAEKERLARRVVELREMPPMLARRMAFDAAGLAALVIERADVLDEQDLARLVKSGSHAHQLALAARPLLPVSVTDELVACGRADVIEALLRNPSAKLSRRAFRYLVGLSRREARFAPLLLAREDMLVDAAYELFWHVESPLRWEVVMRFSLDRRLMAEALSDLPADAAALADPLVRAVMSTLGLKRPPPIPQGELCAALAAWLNDDGQASALVMRALSMSRATLERIRRDPWGEPQIVLFKAQGAPRSAIDLIKEALAPRWPERERSLRMVHLSRLFDSIARDWAELLLKLWDKRPAPAGGLDEFIEESHVNGSSSGTLPSSSSSLGHETRKIKA